MLPAAAGEGNGSGSRRAGNCARPQPAESTRSTNANRPGTAARGSGAGLLGGGRDYRVRFTRDGMRFDPALGPQVPTTRSLQLRPLAVGRGAALQPLAPGMPPQQIGRQVDYLHGDGRSEAVPPNGGGIFNVCFPIPCLPSLVGAQLETQWTMLDPTQAPRPLLPGLSVTPRLQLTIGQ